MDSIAIHEYISALETKIAAGSTGIKDIDTLNEIRQYIDALEEALTRAPQEILDESASAMAPINIENINIYMHKNENEK